MVSLAFARALFVSWRFGVRLRGRTQSAHGAKFRV